MKVAEPVFGLQPRRRITNHLHRHSVQRNSLTVVNPQFAHQNPLVTAISVYNGSYTFSGSSGRNLALHSCPSSFQTANSCIPRQAFGWSQGWIEGRL